jgi:hypothetical protein
MVFHRSATTALIWIIPNALPAKLGITRDSGDGTGSRGQDIVEIYFLVLMDFTETIVFSS